MKLFLLLLNLFFILQINVAQVTLKQTDNEVTLGDQISLYEDKTNKLSIIDVSRPEFAHKFKPSEFEYINYSFTESSVWCKIELKNENGARNWLLELVNPILDSVSFYQSKDSSTFECVKTGYYRKFNSRKIKINNFIFPININKFESKTFYLKLRTDKVLRFSLNIATIETFIKYNHRSDLILGLYFGLVLIMIAYNLFIYFSVRDKSYLYYIIYILFFGLTNADLKGIVFEFAWPRYPYLNGFLPVITGISGYFAIKFTYEFLELKKNVNHFFKYYYKLLAYLYFLVIITGIFRFTTTAIQLVLLNSLIACVFGITVSFYLIFKKIRAAKYFLIAWGWMVVSIITYILFDFRLIPSNVYTSNALIIGSIFEILFLSFAISGKINDLTKDKEQARLQVLESLKANEQLVKEQNKVLEERVKFRTNEIEEQKTELVTQRDNLLTLNERINQQNEEILTQNELVQSFNDNLKTKNIQITASITYAQTIQNAILPQDNIINKNFDFFIYFKPKDIVSGDFYWYTEINNKCIAAVVDCTGHGVPGAFMSLIGNNIMTEIIINMKIDSPKLILELFDKKLRAALNQSVSNNNDGMDISICTFERKDNQMYILTYAGAKSSIIIYRKSIENIEVIKPDRRSIGGVRNISEIEFTNNTYELNYEDSVYLYSDGIIDQNSPERKRFGSNRIFFFIEKNVDLSMKVQKEILNSKLNEFMQDEELRDDITFWGLRFKA